ncbi:MAG: hypothetical protein SOH95_05425 [Bifidobacterium crudilactis]|jgi:hypothetical protein
MIPFETLKAMRQIDTEDATDVGLVLRVSNAYQPKVYFTHDDPIYTDGRNLYGHIIQYGSDGKLALNLRRDNPCTQFTRIPIPKELQ